MVERTLAAVEAVEVVPAALEAVVQVAAAVVDRRSTTPTRSRWW